MCFLLFFLALASSLIWAIVLALRLPRNERLSLSEAIFLAGLFFLFQAILAGIGFGAFGLYKLPYLLIGYASSAIIGALVWWKSGVLAVLARTDKTETWLILILLLVAVWLFSYTGTVQMDGRDHGIYLRAAVSLNKTGSHLGSWPHVSELPDDIKPLVITTPPGTYSLGKNLVYQGLDGFPSVLGFGYLLSGVKGIYILYILIGLGAVLSVLCFARRVFHSGYISLLAAVLFTFSTPLIWSVRMGLSEALSQVLLMGGIWVLWIAHKNLSRLWAIVAALLFGGALSIHLSNWVIIISVCAYIAYLFLNENSEQKKWILASFIPMFAVTALLTYVYNSTFDALYIAGVTHSFNFINLVKYAIYLLFVVFCILFGAKILARRFFPRMINTVEANKARTATYGACIIGIILFLLALYGYLIRPHFSGHLWVGSHSPYSRYAFQWFVWYISPVVAFGGIIGFFLWVRKAENIDSAWIPFIFTALIFTAGMGSIAVITPEHFWLSRRYVSMMLPAFLIFFSYCIIEISKLKHPMFKICTGVAVLFVLIYEMYILSPHAFKRESPGGDSTALANAAKVIPEAASLIVLSDWSVDSFFLSYGKIDRVYFLKPNPPHPERLRKMVKWLKKKGEVYILATRPLPIMCLPFEVEILKNFEVLYYFSERIKHRIPRKWLNLHRPGQIGRFTNRELEEAEVEFRINEYTLLVSKGCSADGWMLQGEVSFVLPRIKVSESGAVLLSLELERPLWDGLPSANVKVYMNELLVTDLEVKSGRRIYEITVAESVVNKWRDKSNLVTIKVLDGFFVPKELGMNQDRRKLSVRPIVIRISTN
jgi:hypothetical protein